MSEIGKTYAQLQTAAGAGIYPAFVVRRAARTSPRARRSGRPRRPARRSTPASRAPPTPTATASRTRPTSAPRCSTRSARSTTACRPTPTATGRATPATRARSTPGPPPAPRSIRTTAIDDGIANAADNCPDNANPGQADGDTDGKGDVCDACPTDANPGAAGCPTTIYNIKDGTTPVGSSVRLVNALVTGKGSNGFFVQVKEGDAGYLGADYSGIFVFTTNAAFLAPAAVGLRVTVDGRVANFQGQLELDSVAGVTATTTAGEAPPAPVTAAHAEVKTGGPRAAQLEGVIVSLGGAAVTAVDAAFGEFTLTSGADTLVVDDFVYVPAPAPLPSVGAAFAGTTGILALRQMASKLEPRGAADLVAGPPTIASLSPALSFARVGQTANMPTFPVPLAVTLTGPAQGDTTVTITSGDAASLTVTDVTIPDGQTTGLVNVTAVAQSAAVTVTGTLGAVMKTAVVRVVGAAEVPTAVTLSPPAATVAPMGTVQFTATLDVPAPVGGTIVGITATSGTVPATVTIAADQVAATFTYTDTAGSGTATVTATLGSSTSDATVTVSSAAMHLVINEVDYDQVGTDTAEYIEIHNPTTAAIPLAGKAIVLVNGSGGAVYDTIDLSSAGTLPAGGYLVIAGLNVTVPAPAIKLDPGWMQDKIQNGAPDGMALVDTATHVLIDALSYEGAMTMVTLPGFPTAVSLVEGTMLPVATADSNTVIGSLCRSPNGGDTDDAAADWQLCAALSPGVANP